MKTEESPLKEEIQMKSIIYKFNPIKIAAIIYFIIGNSFTNELPCGDVNPQVYSEDNFFVIQYYNTKNGKYLPIKGDSFQADFNIINGNVLLAWVTRKNNKDYCSSTIIETFCEIKLKE